MCKPLPQVLEWVWSGCAPWDRAAAPGEPPGSVSTLGAAASQGKAVHRGTLSAPLHK